MNEAYIPGKDLEQRTSLFAKDVRQFLRVIPQTVLNREDSKQLTRSSGSIGANYIEANESLGRKDFLMRIKISRKECKETLFWLSLLDVGDKVDVLKEHTRLMDEAGQLKAILSSIIIKCSREH